MEEAQAARQINDNVLCSDSARYQVVAWIGEGGFGTVAKCLNLATGNAVAVKIHKNGDDDILQDEAAILEVVQTVDPDKKNIVKCMDSFRFQEMSCLVFEMLDKSIWNLMEERKWAPLSLNEIRTITQQVLVAFDTLKGLGIIHCDLKLDNIMLVNHCEQPYKIKLIDFGLALPESRVKPGMIMQHLTYRAPEITLGLPLTTAIDMWSLGCNMAEMYFGTPLFPHNCEFNWMKVMLHLLGQPDSKLLAAGGYTWVFFTLERDQDNQGFRFNTEEEYKKHTGETPHVSKTFFVKSLAQVVLKNSRNSSATEKEDQIAFLSLLKCCLTVDACKRITPRQALNQSFITMSHLLGSEASSYLNAAAQLMRVSHQCNLNQSGDQAQNNETAEQEDTNHGDAQPTVCDHDHCAMYPQFTAHSHGHDLQPNRPSGEKLSKPQSCPTADANETSCDKQSDPEGSSSSESQFYTTTDEEQFSSQAPLVKLTDVETMSIHLGQEALHNDTRINPDGPRWKTFGKRVRKFFRRVRKDFLPSSLD